MVKKSQKHFKNAFSITRIYHIKWRHAETITKTQSQKSNEQHKIAPSLYIVKYKFFQVFMPKYNVKNAILKSI